MSSDLTERYQSSFLSGANAQYVEDLYEAYLKDPAALSADWQQVFAGRADRAHGPVIERFLALGQQPLSQKLSAPSAAGLTDKAAEKQASVSKLINAYRVRGHEAASLDPLGMSALRPSGDLEAGMHGLNDADMDTEFNTMPLAAPSRMTLKDIIVLLKASYTRGIGCEYMHITETAERRFIQERIEHAAGNYGLSADERKAILQTLTQAEGIERYLGTKYVGQKRFSLEGGDALIPLMRELIERCASHGTQEVLIGMAHRGRLNVLVNILGKAPRELFNEFEGKHHAADAEHSGDVKYHMGFSSDISTAAGPVHLALGFNPSHLEIIAPVMAGSVRARQARRNDVGGDQVVPVLLHGDAAFCGQGVVMETFNMSQARGFQVGGTIHVVINNQVGFTMSNPLDARSTRYCTDVAKVIQAPIFHVNGDDPEAVVFVSRLAADFRQTFKKDVVIDLVCYRRHGHNEADEPAATQPLMYQNIRAHKSVRETYGAELVKEQIVSAEEVLALQANYRDALDQGQPVAKVLSNQPKGEFGTDWTPYLGKDISLPETAVAKPKLDELAKILSDAAAAVALHPRVNKLIEDRRKMAAGELKLDWGYAETMAYASLLRDGYQVRIVGQDSRRGTFFHRHAVLHDQQTGEVVAPLARLATRPHQFTVIDSLLSEEAVMAFEYGYATAEPRALVIWEGQFGDFANGAQVVIDQFISSGESKWDRLCGLVLFLPHGYEGQGPEHSSARLERFMQLCATNNMQVCTPTTPAQMFHMLRRQMLSSSRRPLVVMTPKSMLRLEASTSSLDDLASGSFQLLIGDELSDPAQVQRAVVCGGKVYYDLARELKTRGHKNIALIRIEQLYPFPKDALDLELKRFPTMSELVWCQEEPANQGAWLFIRDNLQRALSAGKQRLGYAGRDASAAPAVGHLSDHLVQQNELINRALTVASAKSSDASAASAP